MNLTEKYRPTILGDLVGQSWVRQQLESYLECPHSAAFLFEGATGTGKTTAAMLLARGLGVLVEEAEFGGLWQIASGEQTGESVRKVMNGMHARPFMGSGWRVLIVNEADAMTANAAYVWLDALENLPPQSVVIFTTNHAGKIPARLRDRCERVAFEASYLFLRPCLQELADRIWAAEVGGRAPDVDDFGPLQDEQGNVSFRRLVQAMAPYVRTRTRPIRHESAPVGSVVKMVRPDRSAAARKAWATRRKAVSGG